MARSTGPKGRKLASGFAEPLPYAAGPSIGVDLHAPRLKRSREVVAAWSTALIFERDLVAAFKRAKLPRSAYEGPLELLVTWVEAELVDRAQHPSEFAAAERDLSEGDAIAQGLTVQPPPEPRVRPDCILPGCRGVTTDGQLCPNLRPWGELYCPRCSRDALKAIRQTRRLAA